MTQSALEDLEVIHSILIILWIILFKSGTYDSFEVALRFWMYMGNLILVQVPTLFYNKLLF